MPTISTVIQRILAAKRSDCRVTASRGGESRELKNVEHFENDDDNDDDSDDVEDVSVHGIVDNTSLSWAASNIDIATSQHVSFVRAITVSHRRI
jgi:hypothetical protein